MSGRGRTQAPQAPQDQDQDQAQEQENSSERGRCQPHLPPSVVAAPLLVFSSLKQT